MENNIKLPDGTELVAFDKETMAKLETEINEVLSKYEATYLPVIKKFEALSEHRMEAALYLLKVIKPNKEDERETTTKDETTQTEGEGVREDVSEE